MIVYDTLTQVIVLYLKPLKKNTQQLSWQDKLLTNTNNC